MSYTLSNDGTNWIAEGQLESGRKFRIVCAPATSPKEAAQAVADLKLAQRLQQSAASKTRWAKVAASNGAAASSTPAPASPAAAEKNASIRAKLLGVGDSRIDDDGATVHPSIDDAKAAGGDDDEDEDADGPDEDEDEEEGDDDGEAADLLADVIGTGIYNGVIVGGTAKLLKRRRPPLRPGEPHELFRRYSEEGLCYRVRKLIGKKSKLGPNGKLFVGLAGSIVMMVWNAEEIEPEPGQAAAPAPPPHAQPHAKTATAGAPAPDDGKPKTELRLVRPPAPPPAPPPPRTPPPTTTPPAPEPPENPIGKF